MITELLLAEVALAEALFRYWSSIGSRAQARLLLMERRREYMQRQNFGANSPLARCWLFFLHGKSVTN